MLQLRGSMRWAGAADPQGVQRSRSQLTLINVQTDAGSGRRNIRSAARRRADDRDSSASSRSFSPPSASTASPPIRWNDAPAKLACAWRLGADRGNVVSLVLRGAFLQMLIGLAIGIPISIACGHLIAAQLYQVKSWDPLVLGGSIVALGFCALIASIIPAQRAASINPVGVADRVKGPAK